MAFVHERCHRVASNRSDELSCSVGAKPRIRARTLLMVAHAAGAAVVGRPHTVHL